jgi:hypothetical protein
LAIKHCQNGIVRLFTKIDDEAYQKNLTNYYLKTPLLLMAAFLNSGNITKGD